jgi:hypothetical protein
MSGVLYGLERCTFATKFHLATTAPREPVPADRLSRLQVEVRRGPQWATDRVSNFLSGLSLRLRERPGLVSSKNKCTSRFTDMKHLDVT